MVFFPFLVKASHSIVTSMNKSKAFSIDTQPTYAHTRVPITTRMQCIFISILPRLAFPSPLFSEPISHRRWAQNKCSQGCRVNVCFGIRKQARSKIINQLVWRGAVGRVGECGRTEKWLEIGWNIREICDKTQCARIPLWVASVYWLADRIEQWCCANTHIGLRANCVTQAHRAYVASTAIYENRFRNSNFKVRIINKREMPTEMSAQYCPDDRDIFVNLIELSVCLFIVLLAPTSAALFISSNKNIVDGEKKTCVPGLVVMFHRLWVNLCDARRIESNRTTRAIRHSPPRHWVGARTCMFFLLGITLFLAASDLPEKQMVKLSEGARVHVRDLNGVYECIDVLMDIWMAHSKTCRQINVWKSSATAEKEKTKEIQKVNLVFDATLTLTFIGRTRVAPDNLARIK